MSSLDVRCQWTLVTGPTQEPVTVEEAKAQARITDNASDALIASYITVAREACEQYMGRGLLTQTWKLVLDQWATWIPLPMAAPLQNDAEATPSTAVSVTYCDPDGVQQTLSTDIYDVDTVMRPGAITLKPAQMWPSVQSDRYLGPIEITYVVGWTDPDLVPERIKQGIKQYVTFLELDRDGLEERALAALEAAQRCWSDRIWWAPPRRWR